jgi:hypothetical protein
MSGAEFGMPFRKLPLWLRQYWWRWTYYGKHPASDYLMWMIESIDPEAAEYLALGDAERTKRAAEEGERRIEEANRARREGRWP